MTNERKAVVALLTIKETADLLKACTKTVRRRIAEGHLAVIRDGRFTRIHPDDLQRYISGHRSE